MSRECFVYQQIPNFVAQWRLALKNKTVAYVEAYSTVFCFSSVHMPDASDLCRG